MASALIHNTVQVYFASVLGMDHAGMVSMFEALVASGLCGFLGCSSALFKAALVEFLHNASVRDGIVVSTVQGKPVAISEELFASTFELPMEGLTDLHEVSQDLILEARCSFSYSGKLTSTSCKKREMVFEFRLLNDILAKSVTVRVGSFDAVTHERFLMMTAIYGGVPVNWGRLLFKIFKDMVTPETRQARGYAILTAKTVGTSLAKSKKIYVVEDEPVVEKPEEKKKAVSKKRPAPTDETPVIKRKMTTGKDTPAENKLALVTVAQEAVPIQMVPADTPPALKRKTSKKRLRLPAGSDDEIVEQEPDVVDVVEHPREQKTADDVDKMRLPAGSDDEIVEQEPDVMETDMEEPSLTRFDDREFGDTEHSSAINDEDDNLDGAENEISRTMASFTAPKQLPQEPLRSGEDDDMSGFKQPSKIIESVETEETNIELVDTEELSLAKDVATMTESEDTGSVSKALALTVSTTPDEELLSIEDILKQIPADVMLPSVSAAEITRVKFARSIEIPEVHEGDWYKARVPHIDIYDKGKAPLVENTIKGHPAWEMFSLICADIDFLVQLREKVIADVVSFFHSFSLSKLADLELVKDIIVKEKQFLAWAETDSLETAVRRRELLLPNTERFF
ncbi:splicing factor 3B subunit 1-like [Dorcoceras hygrometricum]|uniref:Splicing factor 3B subunit 1-like n=1 Tax=Dorcoceras hygrometricum TaxID=472368 RepID=A0A2Z7BQE7_9LAMI|nr:splicing factor 3B subunit 1-like [Dorcoceras hygrometricum]